MNPSKRLSLLSTAAILALLMIGLYAVGEKRQGDFEQTTARQSLTRMEVELTGALLEALGPDASSDYRWRFDADSPEPPRAHATPNQSHAEASAANRTRRAWRAARREGEGVRLARESQDTFVLIPIEDATHVLLWEHVARRVGTRTGISPTLSQRDDDAMRVLDGLIDPAIGIWATPRVPTPTLLDSKLLLLLGGIFGVAYLTRDVMLTRRLRTQERVAAEARESLLQRISHELRTPAAAVGALVDALGSGVVPAAEQPQFHALIKSESSRLSEGIERMLRAARGADTRALDRVEMDLAEWAHGTRERWAPRLEAIDLETPDHLPASVDPERLDEAFDALIDNARKYGEPPVLLTLRATDGGVEFTVEDDGAGIPEGHRARIFDRLERVEGKADDPGGFGLGLWAAREVARAHGGELTLQGGNRFVMTLPRGVA